jgi:hypothetical protein
MADGLIGTGASSDLNRSTISPKSMIIDLLESGLFGALLARQPHRYLFDLCIAVVAFGAAMNHERAIRRAIGFVVLLLTGCSFLILGIQNGTAVDMVLGLAALGAAAYSWWYTRS